MPENRSLPFLAGVALGAVVVVFASRMGRFQEPDVAHYREVRDFVRSAFVREVGDEEILDLALHGLAQGLDQHSRYYDYGEATAVERDTAGRYNGIGVVMRQPIAEGRILFPLPGSPAERAEIRVGDRIVAVNGTAWADLGEARLALCASKTIGELVELVVIGLDGATRTHSLACESVLQPTLRHAHLLDSEHGFGYCALASFSHATPDEFDRAFEDLRAAGMRALILDLRGNGGGVLTAAVAVVRRFLDQGVIVSTEGRGETIEHRADPIEARYAHFPLVVLVDEGSASASEVLAGALQDQRAAVIVGSPTHGKGTVQSIRRFAERGSMVKLTSARYFTPAHRSLERDPTRADGHGIDPDILVSLSNDERSMLHEKLSQPSPPASALDALRAWEAQESIALIDSSPSDAQVAAAIDLLRGRRPGPHATGGRP